MLEQEQSLWLILSFYVLDVGKATSCLMLQTYLLALRSDKCVFNCSARCIKKGWLSITCGARTHVKFFWGFFAPNAILHFLLRSQFMLKLQHNLKRVQLPFEVEKRSVYLYRSKETHVVVVVVLCYSKSWLFTFFLNRNSNFELAKVVWHAV